MLVIPCSGYAAGRTGNHPGIDRWNHEQYTGLDPGGDQDDDDAGEFHFDQHSNTLDCSNPNCDRDLANGIATALPELIPSDHPGGDHDRYDITGESTDADRGSFAIDPGTGSGIDRRRCRC